jgi:hypothetical protein
MKNKPKIKRIHIPQHCSVAYDVSSKPDFGDLDINKILDIWRETGIMLYDSINGDAPTFFPLPKDANKIKKQPKIKVIV